MAELLASKAMGTSLRRVDGVAKVRGTAPYAFDHPVENPVYLFPVQATIARGTVSWIDTAEAEAVAGVIAVLTHLNAPRLARSDDAEYAVLQGPGIGFRGQFIAAVLAETGEIACHAAGLVAVGYDIAVHDASFTAGHPGQYTPGQVNGGAVPDTAAGDVEAALAEAAVVLDQTYTTPAGHNNPMEPHSTVAAWEGDSLVLYDSTQGVHAVRQTLAPLFGIAPENIQVAAPNVGGGFGSKGLPHAHVVLAVMAAQCSNGRPVKFALTRQQMFSLAGYRTPTVQHVRLGADGAGRLTAISHEVVELTSRIKEFAEQTAVPARMMYAAPNRRTSHRLVPLDVPVPSWMRAPGECPGMFGLETAMDELAEACGLDPLELRARNEPDLDPETGKPFSSRHLLECFTTGAGRFGWDRRSAVPGGRLEDGWRVGIGAASATYPFYRNPGNAARIAYGGDGTYTVQIGAADLGTGSWTVLAQIAADALDCPLEAVRLEIGDTSLPVASVAGGSSGTASWGGTIIAAADAFRKEHGDRPPAGAATQAAAPEDPEAGRYALHSFGAQFAEVRVHADTGELRVSRMLGVFSAGRIINPRTARSQFIGGMTMGIGMALHEAGIMDPRFGLVVNHDLADYHIPANADVGDVDAIWLEEVDLHAGALGARGIGEIGITGAAAAIANAAYNATGIRIRELPLTAEKFLS
ncbi:MULTISPECIES: xanthine dehydrogenase family protein molybdopterin-binding subunit [unclassified Arthrobacter]|uniref:xanthine dehydrogenase family protein molybdopterin-binding subunit n=1 Tax=unclassified Arthrobacter TaxID=235627 RepID=UPI00159CF911|nr:MULTISPECIES: xanthine dehydrogenase family protein molybdopterin-binding subunit [unclassified Arthrobacter]MCQ9165199.1 xanthine dehydrogenase family protein molybdopterin-binding subunit [Arthrobacter sp. STN4]NVM98067.1 xanthine dehydrogenase family protein molybdopterin-binding subunit [Arthrobacter sp. SDTb3-6]